MVIFPPHFITDIFNSIPINDKDKNNLKLLLSLLQRDVCLPKGEFVSYLLSSIGGYSSEMDYDTEDVYLVATVDLTKDGIYVVGREDSISPHRHHDRHFKLKVKMICDEMGVNVNEMIMFIQSLVMAFERVLFSNLNLSPGRNRVIIHRVEFVNDVMLVYV